MRDDLGFEARRVSYFSSRQENYQIMGGGDGCINLAIFK